MARGGRWLGWPDVTCQIKVVRIMVTRLVIAISKNRNDSANSSNRTDQDYTVVVLMMVDQIKHPKNGDPLLKT